MPVRKLRYKATTIINCHLLHADFARATLLIFFWRINFFLLIRSRALISVGMLKERIAGAPNAGSGGASSVQEMLLFRRSQNLVPGCSHRSPAAANSATDRSNCTGSNSLLSWRCQPMSRPTAPAYIRSSQHQSKSSQVSAVATLSFH